MCDSHSAVQPMPLQKMMMWVYYKWVNDSLDFYLFMGRMGKIPLVGRLVRFFARQYGKYLHGGRAATVEECLQIISQAQRLTVVECACRQRFKHCDKPLNTCIGINTGAEVLGELKHGKLISREEAGRIIKNSCEDGLIRSVTHCVTPNLYVICNCCTCCCVPYRLRSQYGVETAIANGYKAAVIDRAKCTNCGKCRDVCPENAIRPDPGIVASTKCLGCGLCVGQCTQGAISMDWRESQVEVKLPGMGETFLMYAAFLVAILPLALGFKVFHR